MAGNDYFDLTQELIDHFESLSWLEPEIAPFVLNHNDMNNEYSYMLSSFNAKFYKIQITLSQELGVIVYLQLSIRGKGSKSKHPFHIVYYFVSEFVDEAILNEAWRIYKKLLEQYSD